ncbi:uncharacterized protein HD556DRAFT_1448527 [Suillus plorans]|uniref:Uncharacterized protein n=1 Tax=Suillus plorans TaxID=116603 RepID=A0A9P7AG09_9AGAM|nr:uncharacterized protein HD556DRAFT_1448527 [Suillus plorans]KAG1787680.1 hypothetical protein HD556DRAFT_1448527 [Suillus plorans]
MVTRGESYTQRLYASSFSEQFKVQTQQQPSSSGLGECPGNQVPAGPQAPYDARASLLLNTGHNDDPQTASALDFYYGTVSKLDLESPVPDPGTNSPGAPHPQSAIGSTPSMAHSSVHIQAAHGLQSSTRRSPVTVDISDGPPPSPAADPRWSSQVGLHSRSLSSTIHVMPGRSTSSDLPLRPESVKNIMASPVPPETSPRVFSPYSEDYPTGPAYVAVTTSTIESMTPPSDPLPAPTQIESLDVGGSEEVPLYSLIDEEPPPPDFDESQSMRGMTKASMYYAESPIVLAPPDVPSPHGSDAVSGAIPSSSANTPSFIGAPHTLSPAPLLGSPRMSLAMPDVMSYPMGIVLEDVKENLYGYFVKDLMPDKSLSHPSMEASSSSRTQFRQVVSDRQPRYNTIPQDIPHPPISLAVSLCNDASAEAFSTAPLPALPLRRPVAASPAPITTAPLPTLPLRHPGTSTPASITAAPLRALSPRHPVPSTAAPITAAPLPAPPPRHPALPSRHPVASTPVPVVTFTPSPTMPARPHTLNPRSSHMNPGNFRPATSSPLRPSSSHQPTRLPLTPGVRRGFTFPPSSAGTVASTPAPVTAFTASPAMLAHPHTLNPRHPVNFGATSLPSQPGSSHQPMHLPLPPRVRAGPTFPPSSAGTVASTSAPVTAFTASPAMPARPHTLNPRHPVNFRPATSLPLRPSSSHQPMHLPLPPRVRAV